MPVALASTFQIYNDQFFSGLVEQTQQDTSALGSVGITVNPRSIRGDYDYRSLFKKVANIVTRRDTTSTGAATSMTLQTDQQISVKLSRKIGPFESSLDAWRKAAIPFASADQGDDGARAFSRYFGAAIAKDVSVEMLDTSLIAAWKALEQGSANKFTIAANGTMTTSALVSTLALMGDASARIRGWVMHSKVFYDLVQQQISANILQVTGGVVNSAMPVTLNRPVYVTDSPSLLVSGTPNLYRTIGFVDAAIKLEPSEKQEMAFTLVTGLENLVYRMQGEYAYNLRLQGYKWDVANGGANPNSTAVSTATNWDQWATSFKDLAGVVCISG